LARPVDLGVPIARRIGRERFIDQDDLRFALLVLGPAELELRIGQ